MYTVYLKYFVQFFYHPYVYILFSFLLFLCLSIFTNISIFLSTTLPLYLYTVPFCLAALLFIPPSNSLSLCLSITLTVSISQIFLLPNHPSRIFFRGIPNDAKKSLRPLGHMRPVGSISQVKIDDPGTRKYTYDHYKIRKCY